MGRPEIIPYECRKCGGTEYKLTKAGADKPTRRCVDCKIAYNKRYGAMLRAQRTHDEYALETAGWDRPEHWHFRFDLYGAPQPVLYYWGGFENDA